MREIYTQTIWCGCHSKDNHKWAVKTCVLIVYLKLKFDEVENYNSTQTMIFLSWVKLKKSAG